MKRVLRKATKARACEEMEPACAVEANVDPEAFCMKLPAMAGEHPNRLPFEGCLTLVDVSSEKSPSGARGHCVILTRAAAVQALPGLLGMAISFRTSLDGHDVRQKCGVITSAHLEGNRLMVGGFAYARDYPEMRGERFDEDKNLGMSYELADAHVLDMRAKVWTLTRATFTGAAVLLRSRAAYRDTYFRWLNPRSPRPARYAKAMPAADSIEIAGKNEAIL